MDRIQVGGVTCSICGSLGTNKSTCPLNPDAVSKNKVNASRHPNALQSTEAVHAAAVATASDLEPLTYQNAHPDMLSILSSRKSPVGLGIPKARKRSLISRISRSTHLTVRDRLLGLMLGGALGDALGAAFEHIGAWKHNQYTGTLISYSKQKTRFKKDAVTYSVGQVTDDTEMSMCIAHSIATYNTYNVDDIIDRYRRWANSGIISMGKNTKTLFRVNSVAKYHAAAAKQFSTEEQRESKQSNGALMRCGLLSLTHFKNYSESESPVITDCMITNPSSVALDCNWVLTKGIYYALIGYNKSEILELVKSLVKTDVVMQYLNYAENGDVRSVKERSNKGWCVYGLYLAFYTLIHMDSYKASIDYIVFQKGDTDTNACIAGYLLGAYYGYSVMDQDTVTRDNINTLMKCTTEDSYETPSGNSKQRPDVYLVKNYVTSDMLNKLLDIYVLEND